MITDRQWIATATIGCLEVAFEIRTPYLVAVAAVGQWQLGWSGFTVATAGTGQTLFVQK